MTTVSKIQELIDEGKVNYEERRRYPNREPLPNFFDCLDGPTVARGDQESGKETEIINCRKS